MKKRNILLATPFVLFSCSPTSSAVIVAHRGYHATEVENTYGAFVAAGKRNVYAIETDIRFSKDGGIICNHDGKLFGTDVEISQTPFDELMHTRVGGSDTNPTYPCSFDKYLDVCVEYEKVPFIEWKTDPSNLEIEKVFALIQSKMDINNVVFISFYEEAIVKLNNKREEGYTYDTYVLCSTTEKAVSCIEKGLWVDVQWDKLTPSMISSAKAKKQKIGVWTVDDVKVSDSLHEQGVDFVTSNLLSHKG